MHNFFIKVDPPKLLGKKGDFCATLVHLQVDGTTSCGNWIYSQSYTQKKGKVINMMARRGKDDPTGLGLFPFTNKPGAWEGDVPDDPAPPMAAEGGKYPFIMRPDGMGAIFGPGLVDGPFPEHYEPLECPLQKNPMSKKHAIRFGDRGDMVGLARKAGYEKVYGEKDLDSLGVIYAFKDPPKIYGMDEKPMIPGSVVFWHRVLKPLAYIGLGGAVAASLLHYVAFGPKKDEGGSSVFFSISNS